LGGERREALHVGLETETCLALMQLQEQGLLSVDDKVKLGETQYFSFPNHSYRLGKGTSTRRVPHMFRNKWACPVLVV